VPEVTAVEEAEPDELDKVSSASFAAMEAKLSP
jgi:hypothetical protein